jgi:cell fate (sporulation/competence/biofilm development) regulator YlbF (YheA/YmcA/DUF963 family)
MAAPLPCDACGAAVRPAELESGAALRLAGRTYCRACKSEAAAGISLDDLGKVAPAPAPRKPPPPRKLPPADPSRRRPAVAPAGKGLPLPLLGGLGASAAALIVILLLLKGRNTPRPAPAPSTATTPSTAPATSEPTAPDAAFGKLEALAKNPATSPGDLLRAADKALPSLKGTPHESRAREIRAAAAKELETAQRNEEFNPVLSKLQADSAADASFARFVELQDRFQKARALATRISPERVLEVQRLQTEYVNRYEKAAEPHLRDIQEEAAGLAGEGRFNDALRKIETFPAFLRHSGAWRGLERLRDDIQARAKAAAPGKK